MGPDDMPADDAWGMPSDNGFGPTNGGAAEP